MPYKDRTSPEAIKSQQAARRRHYEANRDQYIVRAKEGKERLRQWVRDQKTGPCTDCGETYPYYVMEFDHIGTDKVLEVSGMLTAGYGKERIAQEIAKCELVCANCHKARTWMRLQQDS